MYTEEQIKSLQDDIRLLNEQKAVLETEISKKETEVVNAVIESLLAKYNVKAGDKVHVVTEGWDGSKSEGVYYFLKFYLPHYNNLFEGATDMENEMNVLFALPKSDGSMGKRQHYTRVYRIREINVL